MGMFSLFFWVVGCDGGCRLSLALSFIAAFTGGQILFLESFLRYLFTGKSIDLPIDALDRRSVIVAGDECPKSRQV